MMEPGAVYAWLVPVDVTERAAARRALLLSPEEQARARRYKSKQRAAQFIAGRAALRAVLGRIAGVDPRDLGFRQNAHGKPELANGPPIHFNVAHSDAFALIGVTGVGPVGVDLEAIRPVRSLEAVARRWLSCEELDRLARAGWRDEAFLRLWTRKEALLKAWGVGLAWGGAREVSACGDQVEECRPQNGGDAPDRNAPRQDAGPWTIRSWSPSPGYVAAVAAPGESWRLVCEPWDWNADV